MVVVLTVLDDHESVPSQSAYIFHDLSRLREPVRVFGTFVSRLFFDRRSMYLGLCGGGADIETRTSLWDTG